jgi:hypothetical protein
MRNKTPGKPLVEVFTPPFIKTAAFQAVTFFDGDLRRQVIVLYSLGQDGIIREFTNNKWTPYPIPAE